MLTKLTILIKRLTQLNTYICNKNPLQFVWGDLYTGIYCHQDGVLEETTFNSEDSLIKIEKLIQIVVSSYSFPHKHKINVFLSSVSVPMVYPGAGYSKKRRKVAFEAH